MTKHDLLRRHFGHEAFRPGQETMVDALLSGRDALGIMPTGAGKSVCYQIPALMLPGITLVVSPLISLMADQVAALKANGVAAAYLNSSLSPRQMDLALERAAQGAYKIIYVAPERLETGSFRYFASRVNISMVAVDEAHCVSQWGQDFRPVYLRIADFVDSLPRRPVIGAFTATATDQVRRDIVHHLHLLNPQTVTTGFDRPNLYFEVVNVAKGRDNVLLSILREKRRQSGIVYCATRKAVEAVTDKLIDAGFSASRYHAGLSDEERRQNQEDFQYDRVQIMVATNAFGMGIDKSNVRFVIHYNMPRSMEAYYQEAGRAGRDGEDSDCILLFMKNDIMTARWMIEHGEPNPDLSAAEQSRVRIQDERRLQDMIDYCQRDVCNRAYILRYFGERDAADCGHCGHCTGGRYAVHASAPIVDKPRRSRMAVASAKADKPVKPVRLLDATALAPDADDLFELLRAVRLEFARQQHVPPYIICTDLSLNDMVRMKPRTKQALLTVKGLGEAKVARYGDEFLRVIGDYVAAHPAKSAGPPKTGPSKASPAKAIRIPSTYAPQVRVPEFTRDTTSNDDLQDAYLSGMAIAEIAEQTGLSASVVRQRLRDMDLIF